MNTNMQRTPAREDPPVSPERAFGRNRCSITDTMIYTLILITLNLNVPVD